MTSIPRIVGAGLLAVASTIASAESLRCNGQSVSEGDSRVSLLYKCGPPMLADSYCAPLYFQPWYQPVSDVPVTTLAQCLWVEEWLYDRGPGNLLAVIRIRSGIVWSITYGRQPR